MLHSVVTLPWLPAAPADFSAQCQLLESSNGTLGAALQFLASSRLSLRQASALSRTIKRCRSSGRDFAPLSNFRLGVLASSTADLLLDCLPAAAARHGVALEIFSAPYDQVMQQALDKTSAINTAHLDAVLLAVDHRWLNLDRPNLRDGAPDQARAAIERLRAVVDALRGYGKVPAILQTLPTPPQSLFGNYDRRFRGSTRAMIDDANRGIVALAQETGSYLLETAGLAEQIGTDLWFDAIQWVSYKLPFSAECFPVYAETLGRMLGSIRGKARKCLVLDLDNTLWGGVIGDDGLEGIHIGQGSPRGESFLALQQAVLELRDRGVILAVCSKNDDAVARAAFREHPEMLLRESHIAVFNANWIDKPSNLEAIAKTLNVGLDALVLLDDNPAERSQVRAALPIVAVPELPSDPALFAWYLAAAGYFEAVSFSNEDRLRAESYTTNLQRSKILVKSRDLGDYLASLEMVIKFAPFDAKGRQRIAQLINKTNQFNLTTRRRTEAEVFALEGDDSVFTLQVWLADKFGDLGMIGVIICQPAKDDVATWIIDTWLMSCRVLGRNVEQAMLAKLMHDAQKRRVCRIVGFYSPTAKNGMVADHYKKLGFRQIKSVNESKTEWELSVLAYTPPKLPMRVEDGSPLISQPAAFAR